MLMPLKISFAAFADAHLPKDQLLEFEFSAVVIQPICNVSLRKAKKVSQLDAQFAYRKKIHVYETNHFFWRMT